MITVSLVSHGHGRMLEELLGDMADLPEVSHIVLTFNIAEPKPIIPHSLQGKLTVIENSAPKGFAANHNAAFAHCKTAFFCVMNPDVRVSNTPFPFLLAEIDRLQGAVIAPTTVSPLGYCEDSVRHFPTLLSLAMKAVGAGDGRYRFALGDDTFPADWVGGMFMLFRADAFRKVGGFDEGFFLYYEDVDICARLWKMGGKVLACPGAAVIHDAQRTSRRKARYMRWHASSMARYFAKHWLRLPRASEAP